MPVRKKFLYDCDNTMGLRFREVDDGLTLLYLLGCTEIDLLGVTTTFGNGTIDEVTIQTEKVLKDLGRDDIPLVKGSGARGQGPSEAAHFLAKTAASYPGEMNLVATGPLGNLRAASELDPHFFSNIDRIACMGGCLRPVRVGWRNVPELNFSADPEAAFVVLNAPCPVTVMNTHICLQASFGWMDLWRVRFMGSKVHGILRNWLISMVFYWGIFVFYLWDLLPAVYLTSPDLFDDHWVRISSTEEDLEKGKLILSPKGDGARVNMPTQIMDIDRFKEILLVSWARLANDWGKQSGKNSKGL